MPSNSVTLSGEPAPSVVEIFPTLSRTTAPTPVEFSPGYEAVGLELRFSQVVSTGSPSLVYSIEYWNPTANGWLTIIASVACLTTLSSGILVDPRITAAANVVAQRGLKPRMRVVVTPGTADPVSYNAALYIHN